MSFHDLSALHDENDVVVGEDARIGQRISRATPNRSASARLGCIAGLGWIPMTWTPGG